MEDNKSKKILKLFFDSIGLTSTEVIEKYNNAHPENKMSPQNFSNKLSRGSIRFAEVLDILDAIGYQVDFVKKGGFVYDIWQTPNMKKCVIFGKDVYQAKKWLSNKIDINKDTRLDEIIQFYTASELFDVGFYADDGILQIFKNEEQKENFDYSHYQNMFS